MQKLASTVERSLFLGSVFVMYMLAMLASLAKPFVQLVVTSKWEPALPLIYIMVSGYVMYLVLQPCMQLMKSLGDARSPLIATVLKFSLNWLCSSYCTHTLVCPAMQ
jgi:O-antigen/teichoic acid export membrane protein